MTNRSTRRKFLATSSLAGLTAYGASLGFLEALPTVSAADAGDVPTLVRLPEQIDPLVRLIEETPRPELIERVAARIRAGASYQEVLAALLLAGVRNVRPYPSVGFKFHAVLVVNSCHLAALAGPDEDCWLPLFWAMDHFKSSQADEAGQGGWRMTSVDESRLPAPENAQTEFTSAMDTWDAERADRAVTVLARRAGTTRVFNLLAAYAARDFRSIGHKAIYLANGWRTLQVIGWTYAEPVLRSLVSALMNHTGEPNPGENDLDPDRSWRSNRELVRRVPDNWQAGPPDDGGVRALHEVFRQATPMEAARQAAELLQRGMGAQSVWDAVFTGAGELLMRQPGIIGLHGLTTANAMRYLQDNVMDESLRKQLLLQACSFNAHFRIAAAGRGRLADRQINGLMPAAMTVAGDQARDEILQEISKNRSSAAEKVLGYLSAEGDPKALIDAARRMVFLKGMDSHDYKFSSAVLEDYFHVSPQWRDLFLALSVFNLRGAGERTNPLVDRTREAFA